MCIFLFFSVTGRSGRETLTHKCWISHITHFAIKHFEIFCIYQACLYISSAFWNFDMGSIKRVCIYFLKKCLKSHIDHAIKHFDILGTTCTLRPICIFCFKLSMMRAYIIHSKYCVFIFRVVRVIINCRYTISNHPVKLLHPFTKE